MNQPLFNPGQKAKWNLEKLSTSQFSHLPHLYGQGPFKVNAVEDIPPNNKWPNEHPQFVEILTPKGKIKIRGKFLLPA